MEIEYYIKNKIDLNLLNDIVRDFDAWFEIVDAFFGNEMTYPLYNFRVVKRNKIIFHFSHEVNDLFRERFLSMIAGIDKEETDE